MTASNAATPERLVAEPPLGVRLVKLPPMTIVGFPVVPAGAATWVIAWTWPSLTAGEIVEGTAETTLSWPGALAAMAGAAAISMASTTAATRAVRFFISDSSPWEGPPPRA